jgi:hypothetical protein
MSLVSRVSDLAVRIATEFNTLKSRVFIIEQKFGTTSQLFNDKFLVKRLTITNSSILSTDKIMVSVSRQVLDQDDLGLMFLANVVRIQNGSFEVVVSCLSYGMTDQTGLVPNEIVNINWLRV